MAKRVPAHLPGTKIKLPPALAPLLVPIDSIHEDPANPRKTLDIGHLVGLMKRFGYLVPVVVNADGLLLAGHQRRRACVQLGARQIPAIPVDHDPITGTAYNIADNRAPDVISAWDDAALVPLLAKLQAEDSELAAALGWAEDELAAMLAPPAAAPDPVGDGDGPPDVEPPAPPADPVTKLGEVIQLGAHTLHCADCMAVMATLPDNSVDAMCSDPPYGLSPDGRARTWDDIEHLRREGKGPRAGFMGKAWDAGVPGLTWAREVLRVLKPGGYLIAFSATRTYHRLACSVEDAGFLIRDMEGWITYQGFPKSHDISKAIDAAAGATRKPVGKAYKVPDAKRTRPHFVSHGDEPGATTDYQPTAPATPEAKVWDGWGTGLKPALEPAVIAQKPISEPTIAANVLKWGTGALHIDACRIAPGDPAWPGPNDEACSTGTGVRSPPSVALSGGKDGSLNVSMSTPHPNGRFPANIYACPKPSARERTEGCDDDQERHSTVKPRKLFHWLLQLITPPGGVVLEPFAGSGTTLVAADGLDLRIIAVEREPGYCDIIRARMGEPADAGP